MTTNRHTLHNTDIPQSNSLPRVRLVVEALAGGANTTELLAEKTGMERRQVDYALQAARILGWAFLAREARGPSAGSGRATVADVDGAIEWAATPLGEALVKTGEATAHERACFRESFEHSPELQALAPDLLDPHAPSEEQLVTRIERVANCSRSTAVRRAQTLLAWRQQILDPQGDLFR